MREINLIIITTLVAILFWVGLQASEVLRERFVNEQLLEISLPINGTIDTDYLIKLE